MKKLNIKIILFALAVTVGLLCWYSRTVVVSGKAQDRFHSWGYKVEQFRFHRGASLEIWDSHGLKITYHDSDMIVSEVEEEQWLPNQRAIYLHLSLSIQHDSLVTDVPAKILYDYKRGELYVTSPDPLWREGEWTIRRGSEEWMSEAEFQTQLKKLNK